MVQVVQVEMQSVQSLFIEMRFGETPLSTGTAFLSNSPTGKVLITNRHNVTGRRQDNNKPLSTTGGVPDRLRVWRNDRSALGKWIGSEYQLYDTEGQPQWFEHPTLGPEADFIALKVDDSPNFSDQPYDTAKPQNELAIRPAELVSVIGFPFGKSASGRFAIWVSGFLATDLDIDYDNKPQFLIDCRTRPGQSGSPVVAIRRGTATFRAGGTTMGAINIAELLGIYSGRMNDSSDLGIVWKRSAIHELVQSIG